MDLNLVNIFTETTWVDFGVTFIMPEITGADPGFFSGVVHH